MSKKLSQVFLRQILMQIHASFCTSFHVIELRSIHSVKSSQVAGKLVHEKNLPKEVCQKLKFFAQGDFLQVS